LAQLPFVGVAPRAGAQLTKLAGGWAASETAVAGVAALVVTALFAGVGSPTAPADAAVDVTARGPKPVVLDASDGTGVPPGGADSGPGGGLGSAGAGTPGGGLGSANAGTPGGGAVPPSPHGSPTLQPQSPPPPAAPSGGGGRPFEIPPGHTSPKPPGPSNADGDPGREVQPTPTWVPGKGNPGGK
jgi:DNA polymerase-3 subunit gamma/tau